MTTRGKLRGFGVLIAALMVGACAGSSPSISASSQSPRGSASPTSTTAAGVATPSDQATSGSPRLVALVKNGTSSLWALDGGKWNPVADLGDATGIAAATDGLAVMRTGAIHFLPARDLTAEARLLRLSWPGGSVPAAAAFAVADDGKVAFAIADEKGASYAVAGIDGQVSALEPAATQPFSPLVGWLDANRRLILVTDPEQASRLGVRAGSKTETLTAIGGCRWFAVSGDDKTIAVVTDAGLYADTATVLLGNQSPARIDQIPETDVAWSLALSHDGRSLAVLEGRVGDDGKPTGIREVVYSHDGAAWKKILEVPVPFASVIGQAWVG